MQSFLSFIGESTEKHTVVAFGRMNPPTQGHQKLLDTIQKKAKEVGGTAHMHLSQSQDSKKNPLSHDEKVDFVKKMMPHHAKMIRNEKSVKTFVDVLKHHSNPDHELHIMAGGDRVEEYKKLADKYNGKEFHYKKIHVHSAGDRDPDAEGTEGMSASKLRAHAAAGEYDHFKSGLPSTATHEHAKALYDKVRENMSIKESISFKEFLALQEDCGDETEDEVSNMKRQREEARRRKIFFYLQHSLTEEDKKKVVKKSSFEKE